MAQEEVSKVEAAWIKAGEKEQIGYPVADLESFFGIFRNVMQNNGKAERVVLVESDVSVSGCLRHVIEWKRGGIARRFHAHTYGSLREEFDSHGIPWNVWG